MGNKFSEVIEDKYIIIWNNYECLNMTTKTTMKKEDWEKQDLLRTIKWKEVVGSHFVMF